MKTKQTGLGALYLILFLSSLSLHVQMPIFTPYAIALGATSFFISIMMSCSSFTSFWGHLIAGPLIDKIGKKSFIVVPLFITAILITAYAYVSSPVMLLVIKVSDALVLSFMGPAALSLLSAYARNSREQGKNMAIHGLMGTIANIIAPILGGKLDSLFGYKETFHLIGISLFVAGAIAIFFVKEADAIVVHKKGATRIKTVLSEKGFFSILLIGFAMMYGSGTLHFELPFLTVERGLSTYQTGLLFSYMGLGTLSVLILFGLQRISAFIRTITGLILLCLIYFQLAAHLGHLHLGASLFCLGAVMGLLFPALTTLLSEKVSASQFGTAFGLLSAAFSLGFIVSSLAAGVLRTHLSPYFLVFATLVVAITYSIYDHLKESPTSTVET
ncbi:MFS transporter [Pullulanibacillus sp. KACC 23026]|uniref:MFS transporter n=1 Tax=Pullulanibacillus sp. KACC 23026 TaxID=3028315 RepID=UPI0023AE74CB|nr:MFS transporter [Pullulanibacillus sp. KACC 23026]WEG12565.1 MFS transporter [Pullulanibacillus sp. KACC 23026]